MSFEPLIEQLRGAARPSLILPPEPEEPSRAAFLSGSFDPPTLAHVAVAEAARDRAELVVLLYSVRTLPKEGDAPPPLLSEGDRLAALKKVCENRDGFVLGLCSHGLLVDQIAAARERFPVAELFLVVGSDKVLQMLDPRWYRDRDGVLDALLNDARVLYVVRAGDEGAVEEALRRPENARWLDDFRRLDVDPAVAAISSRQVRELHRRGERIDHLVPPEARSFLPGRDL